jgi:hypothetical protein
MSDDAPRRWLDDPDAPEELKRDVRHASQHPPAFDLSDELRRLREADPSSHDGREERSE